MRVNFGTKNHGNHHVIVPHTATEQQIRDAVWKAAAGLSTPIGWARALKKADELLADPWAFGPWCWIADEVRLFKAPIPCRGMQGLWPFEDRHGDPRPGVPAGLVERFRHELQVDVRQATTLLQPYATALAIGPKEAENRPVQLSMPTTDGRWLGLHAGKALYGGDDQAALLVEWWRRGADQLWPEAPDLKDFPRGAMLGAVHFQGCLRYPSSEQLTLGGGTDG